MKAFVFTIALFCSLVLGSSLQANAQSENALIGKARGEVSGCLDNSTFNIDAQVSTTGICIVSGFTKRVTFYASFKCQPNKPCLPVLPIAVAFVDFDCEGNVIGVACTLN